MTNKNKPMNKYKRSLKMVLSQNIPKCKAGILCTFEGAIYPILHRSYSNKA